MSNISSPDFKLSQHFGRCTVIQSHVVSDRHLTEKMIFFYPKKFLYFKDIEVFSFPCTVGRDLDKDTRVWLVKSFCQVKNSLSSLRLCVWHLKAACSVSTVDKWGAETWNRDDQPHVQLHVIATKKPELGEEINKDGSIYQSINQSIMSEILYRSKRTNQVDQKIYYISFLFVLFL